MPANLAIPAASTASQSSRSGAELSGAGRSQWLISSFGLAVLLTAICFLAFGYCLRCNFLADDLLPITYLYQGFHHHPEILVSKLLSPWQEKSVQLFWRPGSELSLIADYAVHGPLSWTFHLTNLIIHSAVAVVLFLLSRRLLKPLGNTTSNLTALTASALFAAHPLNAEAIVWIIGRVDTLCALFYLLTLYLFIARRTSGSKAPTYLPLATFAAALSCKESAITLPAVLGLYLCLFGNDSSKQGGAAGHSMASLLRPLLPYAIVAGAFVIARAAVIGNLIGGYQGSIGQSYIQLPWLYPITNGNLWKLFYPFNEDLFSRDAAAVLFLRSLYIAGGLTLLIRAVFRYEYPPYAHRILLFCSLWIVLCILPGWKFAIIQPALAGGRFAYLPLAPGCLLASALLFGMLAPRITASSRFAPVIRTMGVPAGCLLAMLGIGLFVLVDRINGSTWLEASTQVSALRASIKQQVATLPADGKLVILNVPTHWHGAHICYRYEMLASSLKPPFMVQDISDRVVALQLRNNGELLNRELLDRLANYNHYRVCAWDCKTRMLIPMATTELARSQSEDAEPGSQTPVELSTFRTLHLKDRIVDRHSARFLPPLNPEKTGFLRLRLIAPRLFADRAVEGRATLRWPNNSNLSFTEPREFKFSVTYDGNPHDYFLPVGERKSWLLSQKITDVCLDLTETAPTELLDVQSIDQAALVPVLKPLPHANPDGEDALVTIDESPCWFAYDAAKLSASGALVEVSEPQSSFEHYSGHLRDSRTSPYSLFKMRIYGACGRFFLSSKQLAAGHTYEVRVFAINAAGRTLGFASDPIGITVR
jgi:hypothetical protein